MLVWCGVGGGEKTLSNVSSFPRSAIDMARQPLSYTATVSFQVHHA